MDAILKLNSVSTMADIKKIRQLYDQVEIHVSGLQAQGVDSAQYGMLLIPIMMAKIPKDLSLILSRQFCGDNWNLDELLQAFKTELDAYLRVWEYQAVLIKYTHHYQNGREKKLLEIQQRQLWRHLMER